MEVRQPGHRPTHRHRLLEPTQPGTARRPPTVFAPVSLLFFLTVMVILGVLSGQNLHPVNYGFLSAAFFAFHLLLAYLVDHISIHTAFLLASLVSVFLVVSHRRRGRRHSLRDREGRPGTVRLPSPLQLRLFLRGLHRPDRDRWRNSHAVRDDAGNGSRGLGRGVCAARRREA